MRRRSQRRARLGVSSLVDLRRRLGVEEASRRLLLYFVVPLWLVAGVADWWCHRRTQIERTAGTRESILHAIQMSEGGVPALLGLLAEVNAGVLLTTYVNLALHQATAAWDVAYADGRREVTPTEQHIHGMLEQIPVMAAAILTVLHWDQARTLIGAGGRADFRLRGKRRPLRRHQVAGLFVAVSGLVIAPYAEELRRCLRTSAPPEPDRPAPS